MTDTTTRRMDNNDTPSRMDIEQCAELLFRCGASFDMFTSQMRRALSLNAHERLAISIIWARGPQAMSDLGMWIPLSRAAVTTLVDRLESAGLVERGSDDADRRRTVVSLTDDAIERMKPVLVPWGVALAGMLDEMSDDEWRTIARFAQRFSELNDAQSEELAQLDDVELRKLAMASGDSVAPLDAAEA